MRRAIVTGATGFVGTNLVQLLRTQGWQVRCLVRNPAKAAPLVECGAELHSGSLQEPASLARAVADVDVVFHVAGRVTALRRSEFWEDNVEGTRRLLAACTECPQPPTVVQVSSLAAGGPSLPGKPRRETDSESPVSDYGQSKLSAEQVATEFADRLPLSIVRPPVVFGEGDRNSLTLFTSVRSSHLHILPGFRDMPMSLVHVADLTSALVQVAESGRRVSRTSKADGVYYVTSGPAVTYRKFGELAAAAQDCRVVVLPAPKVIFWIAGALAEGVGQLRGRVSIFNLDKIREAVAKGWECSDEKLRSELGYQQAATLEERFANTVDWYRRQGWL
jgi:nucleoside-diphosphate-sugar epimerase